MGAHVGLRHLNGEYDAGPIERRRGIRSNLGPGSLVIGIMYGAGLARAGLDRHLQTQANQLLDRIGRGCHPAFRRRPFL